jgi:hypothetical protein
MKPQPKIKMGSSPILTAAAKVIIRLGTSVFPEARIALLPTIGITRKIIPVYQMVMYSPTRERTSGLVPKALNKSSIVAIPTTINMPTINRDRVRLLVVSFFYLVVIAFSHRAGNHRGISHSQPHCHTAQHRNHWEV